MNILQNIHISDLRPPEGVHSLTLDSIVVSADIFPIQQRRKAVRTKRLGIMKENGLPTGDWRGTVINEPLSPGTHDALSSIVGSSILGRKRLNTAFAERPGLPQVMSWNKDSTNVSSAPEVSENQDQRRSPQSALNCTVLQLFIDGALRLSVLSTINNKLIPGLKVKANTFESGLADIAPSLWRPGYSLVGIGTVRSASIVLTAGSGHIATVTPTINHWTFDLSVIFRCAVQVKASRR
jgi:hypothetical protein